MIYAEVIGDPIAHSKSPLIHKHWLQQLGLTGDYKATEVASSDLAEFIADRRSDPDWRGCNVTIPHKQAVIQLLDELDPDAEAIGAVNCIVPREGGLVGYNTDLDGVAAALDGVALEGSKVAIVGAGGAARAAVAYLASRHVKQIVVLVRDPVRALALRDIAAVDIAALRAANAQLDGATAIINASPLGMDGCDGMPDELIEIVRGHSASATLFDMVYKPLRTPFLEAGEHNVDGLTMLIGQAARAFELFFGKAPPPPDQDLRDLLTT